MAIRLARSNDPQPIPGVVKAVVAQRMSNIEHQAAAKRQNDEQIKVAGTILRREHGRN